MWEAQLSAFVYENENIGNLIASKNDCELIFTIPETYTSPIDIILLISDIANCGSTSQNIENGIISFSCINENTVCSLFNTGTYTDLEVATDCSQSVTTNFQVWSNEAYSLNNVLPNQTYTIDFCNGYNSANWEAQITIAIFNQATETVETILANTIGCSISFDTPNENNLSLYLIISDNQNCGNVSQQIDNGYLSFACVTETIECIAPSNLLVNSITANSATLSWNATNAEAYNIQLKKNNNTEWTTLSLSNSSTTFESTNLAPCTNYQFRVQAICEDGNSSPFSEIQNFTTTGCANCLAPTNVTISNVTNNSAQVIWNAVSNASNYRISYLISNITWASTLSNSTTFTLAGTNTYDTIDIYTK